MAEIKQVASAQITITDLNDGKSYVLRISDSFGLGGYFSYDPEENKYDPAWGTASLVLTPTFVSTDDATNLLVSGTGISNVKWYEKRGTGEWVEVTSTIGTVASSGKTLTIPTNRFTVGNDSVDTISYELRFNFKDPVFAELDSSTPNIEFKQSFECKRVKQGMGANYVILNATPSDTFYNATDDQHITINASVFSSGTIVPAANITSSKWEYYDDETGTFKTLAPINDHIIISKTSLQVCSGEIYGNEIFKYTANYNGKDFTEQIMITDYSDPIVVEVTTDNGTIFKKGMGNKVLKALVYERNSDGQSILLDDAVANARYTFAWKKFDKSGNGTTVTGSTNSITIRPVDVSVSATYIVSVSESPTAAAATMAYYAENGFRSLIVDQEHID